VRAVDAWLAEHGIPEGESIQRSPAGDWVTIRVPIAQAEVMLDTVSPSAHPFSPINPILFLFLPFLTIVPSLISAYGA
jgi:hypothetical protein